jgi:predicted negative regulator of RcsB-dependent stress response
MENDPTVALYDFYGWLHTNRKRVLAGAVVVAVVAAIVAFVMWNNSEKEASANQALLAVPSLIGAAPPGDPASGKTLLDIGQEYPGTSAGVAAQLLAARELFLGGKYAEAQREFTKFIADHPNHPLVPQANVGIAACMEAQTNITGAVQQYKKINVLYAGNANLVLPVKLTLGRLSEADNKPDQAVQYYKELASLQDPNDPWVVEAYERLRLLIAKHPELNPNPQQPPPAGPSPMLTPNETDLQLSAPGGAAPAPAAPQPPAALGGATPPPGLLPPPILPAPQPAVAPSNTAPAPPAPPVPPPATAPPPGAAPPPGLMPPPVLLAPQPVIPPAAPAPPATNSARAGNP